MLDQFTADQKWSKYNSEIELLIKDKNWFGLGTLYYNLASIVKAEGKDSGYLRQLGLEMKIKSKQDDIKRYIGHCEQIEILANPKACNDCIKHNSSIIDVDNALILSPLPIRSCTNEIGCRCTFLPVIN